MKKPQSERRRICQRICHFIITEKELHTQKRICDISKSLGYEVSPASLSNLILKGKLGADKIMNLEIVLAEILKREVGVIYHPETDEFRPIKDEDWKADPIPLGSPTSSAADQLGIVLHAGGRLSPEAKAKFMSTATKEVIIVGEKLGQLIRYFNNSSRFFFREPLERLLEKGVDVTCYMLDPDAETTKVYYQDLESVLPEKKTAVATLRTNYDTLMKVEQTLNNEDWVGRFKIKKYAHLPSAYFMAVDGAKLMTSSYLFGQGKHNIPVIELHKHKNKQLFELYYGAMINLIDR